jgi:hypothetical protein
MENKDYENFKQPQQQQDLSVSSKLDVNNADQVRLFATQCSVTETNIREAATIVGSSKSMIMGYLKTHKYSSSRDASHTSKTGGSR